MDSLSTAQQLDKANLMIVHAAAEQMRRMALRLPDPGLRHCIYLYTV